MVALIGFRKALFPFVDHDHTKSQMVQNFSFPIAWPFQCPRSQPEMGTQGSCLCLSPNFSPSPGGPVLPAPAAPLPVAQLSWRQRRPHP